MTMTTFTTAAATRAITGKFVGKSWRPLLLASLLSALAAVAGCGEKTAADAAQLPSSMAQAPDAGTDAEAGQADQSADAAPSATVTETGDLFGATPAFMELMAAALERNRMPRGEDLPSMLNNPEEADKFLRAHEEARMTGIPTRDVPMIELYDLPEPAVRPGDLQYAPSVWVMMDSAYEEYIDVANIHGMGKGGRDGKADVLRGVVLLRGQRMNSEAVLTGITPDAQTQYVKLYIEGTCNSKEHDLRLLRTEAYNSRHEVLAHLETGSAVRYITDRDEDMEIQLINWGMSLCMMDDMTNGAAKFRVMETEQPGYPDYPKDGEHPGEEPKAPARNV